MIGIAELQHTTFPLLSPLMLQVEGGGGGWEYGPQPQQEQQ